MDHQRCFEYEKKNIFIGFVVLLIVGGLCGVAAAVIPPSPFFM